MNHDQFIVELRTYIARNFIKQANYADEIGASRAFVSYVLRGERMPSERMLGDLRLTMNKVTTITFEQA